MTSLWRYYDVIVTIFSPEIMKSSIQIVWKWLIDRFNEIWVRKNDFFVIFQIWRHYDVIMTLLWRHFYHFSSEIIKSSIKIVCKLLIPHFNVFWVRQKLICGYFSNLTSLWRHYDVIITSFLQFFHRKSLNHQLKSYKKY